MATLSILTNDDPKVQEKANFFAVYFGLFVSQAGRCTDFELENPLSLTKKILFQLTHNARKCWPTVHSYLQHPLFKEEQKYLEGFSGVDQVKILIEELTKSKKPSELISANPTRFIDAFTLFKKSLDTDMFKTSLKAVISFFTCPHDLKHHREDFKSHTKILVTEYFFRNRDKEYIGEAIPKVLSREIDEFPFPPDIVTDEEKNTFLQNRTLQQQFEAIFTFLDRPASKITFYYRIFGSGLDKNIDILIDKVHFYSRDHASLAWLREEHPEFFEPPENFFIAATEVEFYSCHNAHVAARKTIRRELLVLSVKLVRDFMLDLEANVVAALDSRSREGWTSQRRDSVFTEEDCEQQHLRNNAFDMLRQYEGPARDHIFACEHILLKAVREREMPGHWHWLEALMQAFMNDGGIMRKIAVITSVHSEPGVRKGIVIEELMYAFSFMAYPRNKYKQSTQEAHEAAKSIMTGEIPEWVKTLDDAVVQDFMEYYNYEMNEKDYTNAADYYERILRDAYAQRNSYFHQGNSDQIANIKLVYSLPTMVERFRYIIFEAIRKTPESTFEQIINQLYQSASSKIITT